MGNGMDGEGSERQNDLRVSLRDYMDVRLSGLDRRLTAQLRASEIAIEKSEAAITYRLESLNEFRQTLSDQNKNYATRTELEAVRNAHAAEISSLSRQVYIIVGALAALQFVLEYFK